MLEARGFRDHDHAFLL